MSYVDINAGYFPFIRFYPRDVNGKLRVEVETDDTLQSYVLSTEEEMELLKFLIRS